MGAMWVQIKTHKTTARYFKSSWGFRSAVNEQACCEVLKYKSHIKCLYYINLLKKYNSNNLDILMLPDSKEYKRLWQMGK